MKFRFLFTVFFLSIFCLSAQEAAKSADAVDTQPQNSSRIQVDEYKSADETLRDEEFRRGVQSFWRGSYNEAILQFEKALVYMPANSITLDWLAKSYYYSGLEATAIETWDRVIQDDPNYSSLLLPNKLSVVKERRVWLGEDKMNTKYTEAGTFYGVYNNNLIFAGPAGILPNHDGTLWTTAYASNEILLFDVNGYVIDRANGPLNGFDHPLDIVRLQNGNLLITESAGDRLTVLSSTGKFIKYIGTRGIELGQLVAPLYIACDSHQNIFVTDYGNKRVDVFDKDGNPLFFFGRTMTTGNQTKESLSLDAPFKGLRGPTGIAIIDDIVFVADDVTGSIHQFDASGNYIRDLVEPGTFKKPESLKKWEQDGSTLIMCDKNRVYSVDSNSGAIYENANTGNGPSRIMGAALDVNGNVLVSDYKSNEVYVMARMQDVVGGLFVQIEKVNATKFPKVSVNVKIENRYRQPIVGLQEKNFFITEKTASVADYKLTGAGNNLDYADITLIIDRSEASRAFCENNLDATVRQIATNMAGKGTLRIICASSMPTTEYVGNPDGATKFSSRALKTKDFSPIVPMDLAIRLASNDLINAAAKRAIVILGGGNTTPNSFTKYSINQTASYLNNNLIPCVYVCDSNTLDSNLRYLVDNTRGNFYNIWREQGIDSIVQDVVSLPCPIYSFEYTSAQQTDFGEKYLPLEIEAYLLNRSGRDESGYFAPLE